jgi:porin
MTTAIAHRLLAAAFVCAAMSDGAAWAGDAEPANDLWSRQQLLGDVGGLRSALKPYGVTLSISETSEVLGNPTGGIHQGALYEGLTDAKFDLDLQPYFGWRGEFVARAFQIHGRGLSANNLDNLNTVSSIEADRATRLFELWYEQHIGNWLRIRIGQQAADQEFLVSSTSRLFINSTFGWPTLPGTDLPSGGPAYPLGTPAVRFRIDANDELTFLAGLFNGDPAGPGPGDPQQRDASGTAFLVNDGAFAIAEVRYNPGNTPSNGTYRFGGWYNSNKFSSLNVDTTGMPLASPASNGMPMQINGNYSLYGIIDLPLFHAKGSDAGLTVFTRAMGAPSDRNLVDFYLDGGVTYKGLFGRNNDEIGIAFGYARISAAARQFDTETALVAGEPLPVQISETVVEATYQLQLTPWWALQPDIQYIKNPGGGIPNPNAPPARIGNALVLGLRTVITF